MLETDRKDKYPKGLKSVQTFDFSIQSAYRRAMTTVQESE